MITSSEIKNKALEIGFSACGITEAKALSLEREDYYKNWVQSGFQADMQYLERNIEKRMNPSLLFENTKSIIVVLLNYHNPAYYKNKKSTYTFSEYVLGTDYHILIKNKLSELSNFIQKHHTDSNNRVFAGSAPVLEKYLAYQAGLGSIGKNTLLLTQKGSYFFIGEIFTDLILPYDSPCIENYCLQCNNCINACPTKALYDSYCLDATKCISYHNIESKNEIPKDIQHKMGKQVYGCDICQQVCPCNKNAEPTQVPEFSIKKAFLEWTDTDWKTMNETAFKQSFSDSALLRVGYNKLKRIINSQYKNLCK
jgi:epoxyqueuosine reductase